MFIWSSNLDSVTIILHAFGTESEWYDNQINMNYHCSYGIPEILSPFLLNKKKSLVDGIWK